MTHRLPSITDHHRPQTVGPVRIARFRLLPKRHKAVVSPERTASSGSSAGFETVTGACLAISRTPNAAAAATVRALSP